MKKLQFIILFLVAGASAVAQSTLSVEKIMRDPKTWIGTSPSNPYWSEDGKTIYFFWNPEKNPGDSLYAVTAPWTTPRKISRTEQEKLIPSFGTYNKAKTLKLVVRDGDLFLYDLKKGTSRQLTKTVGRESSPEFSGDEKKVVYTFDGNLFTQDLASGEIVQLTLFTSGNDRGRKEGGKLSEQDQWLERDQLAMFDILALEEEERKMRQEYQKRFEKETGPLEINTGQARVSSMKLSHDGRYVVYSMFNRSDEKRTIVPDYVTKSGYTEDINARSKVGGDQSDIEVAIYDIQKRKNYKVITADLPGLDDSPSYFNDYDRQLKGKREVIAQMPVFSEDGKYTVMTLRSKDNKDRWIALLNLEDGKLKVVDRQTDEAWISGPGIGWSFSSGTLGWLPDNAHFYFQSEESGYSHLYLYNVQNGSKKALTSGKYEVYDPRLSSDKKSWYFEANYTHPGIRQLYRLPLYGGVEPTPITNMGGGVTAVMSPDDSQIAIIHSLANRPDELFIMSNGKKSGEPKQITFSQTEEWKSYDWRMPDFVTFEARDKAKVHARLYRPEQNKKNGAAVIFVHGAGYLQNAHQWWSTYFREYMFHNLLTDLGYTVLDIDYRGSAGYGRDWRTGIYRHMGGFDLTDQVDGAKWLVSNFGVDASKVGIYGGSYGGFITLMAMFTQQEHFAAGAALRSVTDWAHYNHGYTSNILNTPVLDSIAYRKSSPIYYADGLKGALLICHGMVDTNVHFQDVVRLAQRLIELGKDNWEFAVYPMEDHGFVYPSSWTDEYKRILKLFEENLR